MAILGLLEEHDLHGYEIRKQLRDGLGLLANVSFGSLYPALARLEAAGAVEVVTPMDGLAPVTAPPTGSLSGERAVLRARRHTGARGRRSRKVYRITDTGHRTFVELLVGAGSTDDARSFGLRLAFARYLAPQARLALLERRRAQLLQRRDEMCVSTSSPALDIYVASVVQHAVEGVERDIHWVDHLITAERQSGAERGGPSTGEAGLAVAAGKPD